MLEPVEIKPTSKKVLTLLFTIFLIGAFQFMSPITKAEVQGTTPINEEFEWVDNGDNTVTITRYIGTDTNVNIPNEIDGKAVVEIDDFAFNGFLNGVKITNVYIPSNVKSLGQAVFTRNVLESIEVDPDNLYFKDIDGKGLYSKDGKVLIQGTMSGQINEGTEMIGDQALLGMVLTNIKLPSTIKYIGKAAFYDNEISELIIGSNISFSPTNSFASVAFGKNPLQTIKVDTDHPNFKDIDGKGMYTKDGKQLIIGTASGEVAEGTESIRYDAFISTKGLTKLVIPSSVNKIDDYLFRHGTLHEVVIQGKDTIINLFEFGGSGILIHENSQPINKNITIYSHASSGAKEYADQYGMNFALIENGWELKNGQWVYYEDGIQQTGWILDGSTWYYLGTDGFMKTGWLLENGSWYYLNSSGAMMTNWQKVNNIWYYFNNSGSMATGWFNDGGTWYYFNSGGAM
ncbi:leucine-rich repeat protein, partial [Bacillus sp. JJ1566]|uniref:leucine-rich repeat protein n=1 Tax=Bacillus sp. JJ1566 TaxID=3122961 RepID=UPI002FFD9C64